MTATELEAEFIVACAWRRECIEEVRAIALKQDGTSSANR